MYIQTILRKNGRRKICWFFRFLGVKNNRFTVWVGTPKYWYMVFLRMESYGAVSLFEFSKFNSQNNNTYMP